MFSDKLLTLLQSFSKYELNRLRKFLLSPYYNEQEALVRLFDICNQALREGPSAVEALTKERAWKQLFPGKRLDEAQLRRMASDLNHLGLQFIASEYRQTNPVGEWLDLQRQLERPELRKHLATVERQLQRHFDDLPVHSTGFYLDNFQLNWNIFNRASKIVATADYMDKLQPADFYLDLFYLLQKLKLFVAGLSYQNIRSTEHEVAMIPGFWEFMNDGRFSGIPILHIYRRVIDCLVDREEETHFQELINDLERWGDRLSHEDLRECYHIAQNYCALKINEGKTAYYREAFLVFKKMMDRNLLLEDGQLAEGFFKNIITTGLRVGEPEWVERFINEYSDYLPATIRENARSYNLANVYSHQQQYDKVIELLASVEYSDVTYALGAKLILLRTYYETGEYLALDSLIESFRIYLRRNKLISRSVFREYGNFLNAVKKLNALHGASRAEIDRFRQKVADNPAVVSKKWLLEKVNELY